MKTFKAGDVIRIYDDPLTKRSFTKLLTKKIEFAILIVDSIFLSFPSRLLVHTASRYFLFDILI
jgi:hypothetical protein